MKEKLKEYFESFMVGFTIATGMMTGVLLVDFILGIFA